MTPDWLNETVRAFGRQMNIPNFELNARGAAGMRFENGIGFRLEYANEALMLMTAVEVPADAALFTRVLALVHPDARLQPAVRAGYLARTGEAIFVVRVGEREVSVTALEAVFRMLWRLAEQIGRAVR